MANDRRYGRTTYFATVPDWLFGRVSASAIAVYGAIDRFADRDGHAMPRRRTIAEKVGLGETTVKKAVGELEKAGALIRIERAPNGVQTSNEYVLLRDPPGSDSDPPGVVLRPLARASDERNERDLTRGPPVDPPGPATVNRKPVTQPERLHALAILDAFNRRFETSFTADAWLGKIVMRVREHPELDVAAHEVIIDANARDPWWDGAATPSVIYGNGAQFERSMLAGRGRRRRRGLTAEEAMALPRDGSPVDPRASAPFVEGELVGEEDG